jgi:hypothetical protein
MHLQFAAEDVFTELRKFCLLNKLGKDKVRMRQTNLMLVQELVSRLHTEEEDVPPNHTRTAETRLPERTEGGDATAAREHHSMGGRGQRKLEVERARNTDQHLYADDG